LSQIHNSANAADRVGIDGIRGNETGVLHIDYAGPKITIDAAAEDNGVGIADHSLVEIVYNHDLIEIQHADEWLIA
jgi:hypothetical protein